MEKEIEIFLANKLMNMNYTFIVSQKERKYERNTCDTDNNNNNNNNTIIMNSFD